ncbi:MAG: RNA polymerase factor sigma-54 [Flavobacteriales bacterium]
MLKQDLYLKLSQKLSPQQIQLMKLVQLPTLAFEERIKQELEENPALDEGYELTDQEEFANKEDYQDSERIDASDINIDEYLSDDDVPSYKMYSNNHSADTDDNTVPYAGGITLNEYLISQLHTARMSDEDYLIADFLIGSIDEDGYIRRDLKALSDDLMFTQNLIADEKKLEELLLGYIQKLDPVGVGARSLQECLLIQLNTKENTTALRLAKDIVEKSFKEFSKKHYQKIVKLFEIDEEFLKSAIKEIEKLNPKPGKSFSGNTRIVEQITPDFTIAILDGELDLKLNSGNVPELRLSGEYRNLFEAYKEGDKKNKEQKKAVQFVKQKLDSAKWFIDAVKQRENTLMLAMGSIMRFQEEYFLTGDEQKIKPMILKDIADEIKMDISTISRVANSKYVSTPYGTLLIKELFSESMTTTSGEEVSTREIKKILKDAIQEESKKKPLTDEKLSELLRTKGYKVARRTVAKYREQLNIPVARLRKKL